MRDTDGRERPQGEPRHVLAPRAFLRACIEEARRAERYDRPLSVALVRVEGTEPDKGERVDRVVGALVERYRQSDRLARLDRSRLGLLLPETRLAAAVSTMERLRLCAGGPEGAWLSIGLATTSVRLRDPRMLLMTASAELRRAGSEGGGRTCWAIPDPVGTTSPRSRQVH